MVYGNFFVQPLLNKAITGVGNCDRTSSLHTGASNATVVEEGAMVGAVVEVGGSSVKVAEASGT